MFTFVSCLEKLKSKEKKMLDGTSNFLNVKRRVLQGDILDEKIGEKNVEHLIQSILLNCIY
jgi:hypothetical protein